MKVKELIEELKKLDPDARIGCERVTDSGSYAGRGDILYVKPNGCNMQDLVIIADRK